MRKLREIHPVFIAFFGWLGAMQVGHFDGLGSVLFIQAVTWGLIIGAIELAKNQSWTIDADKLPKS